MAIYFKAKSKSDLKKQHGFWESDYAVIKKVEGGYMCFETNTEYETWKKQK